MGVACPVTVAISSRRSGSYSSSTPSKRNDVGTPSLRAISMIVPGFGKSRRSRFDVWAARL